MSEAEGKFQRQSFREGSLQHPLWAEAAWRCRQFVGVEDGGGGGQWPRVDGTRKGMQKMVLLFVIYENMEQLCVGSLKEYLKTIFVWCGGEEREYGRVSSVYLLEKKNWFNPFKYAVSEGEVEWVLLGLYELSIGSACDRYELLAAVNMIYKKTANEAMFRHAEIAQSIVHVLEDEYSDIFA